MKVNQRVALTKRLLQEALLRLLAKEKLESINVTELCAEAQINRATFYRHYNIPRDVLTDMQSTMDQEITALLHGVDIKNNPQKYMETICSFVYRHSDIIRVFISNNSEEDFSNMMNKIFNGFISRKKEFPQLQNIDEDSLRLISSFIAGGMYFMLRCWLLEEGEKTPEQVARLLVEVSTGTPILYS